MKGSIITRTAIWTPGGVLSVEKHQPLLRLQRGPLVFGSDDRGHLPPSATQITTSCLAAQRVTLRSEDEEDVFVTASVLRCQHVDSQGQYRCWSVTSARTVAYLQSLECILRAVSLRSSSNAHLGPQDDHEERVATRSAGSSLPIELRQGQGRFCAVPPVDDHGWGSARAGPMMYPMGRLTIHCRPVIYPRCCLRQDHGHVRKVPWKSTALISWKLGSRCPSSQGLDRHNSRSMGDVFYQAVLGYRVDQ
jgi:hypothetical protein